MAKGQYSAQVIWQGRLGGFVYKKDAFGEQVISIYKGKPRNPRTEAQQLVRAKFALMRSMGSIFSPATALGMKQYAASKRMYPDNCFMTKNYPNVTGTAADNVSIDPSKIICSWGNLTGVVFSSAIGTSTPGTVTVSVTDINAGIGKASSEDSIYAFVYCPDAKAGVLSAAAKRTDGATLSVRYPNSWSGLEVHVYGFVYSAAHD
ncbi:MAG: hypothetical protein J6V98_00770 [Bacteroidales bacterium]|nr:hypothetical protein [Bacteroidales bacterium]